MKTDPQQNEFIQNQNQQLQEQDFQKFQKDQQNQYYQDDQQQSLYNNEKYKNKSNQSYQNSGAKSQNLPMALDQANKLVQRSINHQNEREIYQQEISNIKQVMNKLEQSLHESSSRIEEMEKQGYDQPLYLLSQNNSNYKQQNAQFTLGQQSSRQNFFKNQNSQQHTQSQQKQGRSRNSSPLDELARLREESAKSKKSFQDHVINTNIQDIPIQEFKTEKQPIIPRTENSQFIDNSQSLINTNLIKNKTFINSDSQFFIQGPIQTSSLARQKQLSILEQPSLQQKQEELLREQEFYRSDQQQQQLENNSDVKVFEKKYQQNVEDQYYEEQKQYEQQKREHQIAQDQEYQKYIQEKKQKILELEKQQAYEAIEARKKEQMMQKRNSGPVLQNPASQQFQNDKNTQQFEEKSPFQRASIQLDQKQREENINYIETKKKQSLIYEENNNLDNNMRQSQQYYENQDTEENLFQSKQKSQSQYPVETFQNSNTQQKQQQLRNSYGSTVYKQIENDNISSQKMQRDQMYEIEKENQRQKIQTLNKQYAQASSKLNEKEKGFRLSSDNLQQQFIDGVQEQKQEQVNGSHRKLFSQVNQENFAKQEIYGRDNDEIETNINEQDTRQNSKGLRFSDINSKTLKGGSENIQYQDFQDNYISPKEIDNIQFNKTEYQRKNFDEAVDNLRSNICNKIWQVNNSEQKPITNKDLISSEIEEMQKLQEQNPEFQQMNGQYNEKVAMQNLKSDAELQKLVKQVKQRVGNDVENNNKNKKENQFNRFEKKKFYDVHEHFCEFTDKESIELAKQKKINRDKCQECQFLLNRGLSTKYCEKHGIYYQKAKKESMKKKLPKRLSQFM